MHKHWPLTTPNHPENIPACSCNPTKFSPTTTITNCASSLTNLFRLSRLLTSHPRFSAPSFQTSTGIIKSISFHS
ncbi:hypothetical protein BGZ60DRAFT_423455 [Tricladium varicosporioides]|nr:hypothetical protein BGZ60DRAFT_423455 [Hymenoscyphus varicosporioides]